MTEFTILIPTKNRPNNIPKIISEVRSHVQPDSRIGFLFSDASEKRFEGEMGFDNVGYIWSNANLPNSRQWLIENCPTDLFIMMDDDLKIEGNLEGLFTPLLSDSKILISGAALKLPRYFSKEPWVEDRYVITCWAGIKSRLISSGVKYDPRFVVLEDIEVCFQAWVNGFKVVYVPSVMVQQSSNLKKVTGGNPYRGTNWKDTRIHYLNLVSQYFLEKYPKLHIDNHNRIHITIDQLKEQGMTTKQPTLSSIFTHT